jgi:ABC-type oligopeptide transport system substrate-binding subunit
MDDNAIFLVGNCLDYSDAQSMWDYWLNNELHSDTANIRWTNQDFLDTLTQARNTENLKDRESLYQKAEDILINEDCVAIPLAWASDIWLVKPKLDTSFLPMHPGLENWAFIK